MQTTIPALGTVSWGRRFMPATAALGLLLVFGFAQPGLAQTATQTGPLTLFKNYFVTGDYVVGGWVKGSSNGTIVPAASWTKRIFQRLRHHRIVPAQSNRKFSHILE